MKRTLGRKRIILAFLAPALLIYLVIIIIPTIWSLVYTFFEGSPITGFEFVGVRNYQAVFNDPDFFASLWRSVRYMFIVTTGQVVLGLIIALLYVFYIRKFSFLIRTLIFFPVVLPAVAVAQLFAKVFEISPQLGIFNELLRVLNLEMWVQAWLGQGDTAFWIVCIMDIWRAMGFYAVILYAGLIDIPDDVLESAKLDGAKGWSLATNIVLPMIRPILISAIIFSLNGTLKVFESVIALTNGGPGNSTEMLTMYMYRVAFTYSQYGYGSTIAVFILLLSLIVTLAVYRFSRSDITE